MSVNVFGVPPDAAVQWLREKGYSLDFDWRDIWQEQHASAFSVAKATQLDLLADIRAAVDKALANGQTMRQFRKELEPILIERGWWGRKKQVDPKTGEEVDVQLGSPRRLRTIYQTNLRMAHAAGRWEQIERTAAARPYLRYVAIDDGRTRDEHLAWNGIVLPWDDEWWKTHYPPNGWGCRCKVQQLSARDLERFGFSVSKRPPSQMTMWRNERAPEGKQFVSVPKGIDPGFAYNVGLAPRGSQVATQEPIPLRGSKRAADYGLSPAKELRHENAPEAVPRWPSLDGIADADERYVQLFGTGKPAPVTDPQGLQVTFDPKYLEHLYKSGGLERARYVPRAKQVVEDPAEIWLIPSRITQINRLGQAADTVQLDKVYIGVFHDRSLAYAVVARRDKDGFVSWTTIPVTDRRLERYRQGYLLYQRATGTGA